MLCACVLPNGDNHDGMMESTGVTSARAQSSPCHGISKLPRVRQADRSRPRSFPFPLRPTASAFVVFGPKVCDSEVGTTLKRSGSVSNASNRTQRSRCTLHARHSAADRFRSSSVASSAFGASRSHFRKPLRRPKKVGELEGS